MAKRSSSRSPAPKRAKRGSSSTAIRRARAKGHPKINYSAFRRVFPTSRRLRRRRRRFFRKLKKDGFITHVVKGLSAVKYANRITNADNASTDPAPKQMDSDFALFNICPYYFDPFEPWQDTTEIGSFRGSTTENTLNVPNTGVFMCLPSFLRASAFLNADSQMKNLASCFEEFRIKTAVIDITLPDVMSVPDNSLPTVNNNLFLMWKFNEDIKPPNIMQFMQKSLTNYENYDNWRRLYPFCNASDLSEIDNACAEDIRNAAGSNWHRVRLSPGKAVRIKWHPKCWLRSKTGNMQRDMYKTYYVQDGNLKEQTHYFSNLIPNAFSKPGRQYVDCDAITVDRDADYSHEDDVFFSGPTFLLLDTSHERFATYQAPSVAVQTSTVQSQFKLQCRYYFKFQFRKVKKYEDNNVKDGYAEGEFCVC